MSRDAEVYLIVFGAIVAITAVAVLVLKSFEWIGSQSWSPTNCQNTRLVISNMTAEEKVDFEKTFPPMSLYKFSTILLMGMTPFLGKYLPEGSLKWLSGFLVLVLFYTLVQDIIRQAKKRRFLCSTKWAQEQGLHVGDLKRLTRIHLVQCISPDR